MLQFAGKNRAGHKQELQQRAVDLVKLNSKEVQDKIKELSTQMYRQMGTAASVNPYSRNYDSGIRNGGAAVNEDSSGNGGAESTNIEGGESKSTSSPESKTQKDSDKEQEKVRQQVRSVHSVLNCIFFPGGIVSYDGASQHVRSFVTNFTQC